MRKDLTIDLGDVQLGVWRYIPDGATQPVPTIVMSFGFSGLKTMGLDSFAEVVGSAGLGALVYDHHRFGKSTGVPARDIDPWLQVAENRAHEPKKLALLHSGHHDVYWRKFDEAAAAARDWSAEHLVPASAASAGAPAITEAE